MFLLSHVVTILGTHFSHCEMRWVRDRGIEVTKCSGHGVENSGIRRNSRRRGCLLPPVMNGVPSGIKCPGGLVTASGKPRNGNRLQPQPFFPPALQLQKCVHTRMHVRVSARACVCVHFRAFFFSYFLFRVYFYFFQLLSWMIDRLTDLLPFQRSRAIKTTIQLTTFHSKE